jgi:capsule biosynthesis phosphatase
MSATPTERTPPAPGEVRVKRLVIDLDDTLCRTQAGAYADAEPIPEMIEQVRAYREDGFEIVIHTSRNMRTYEGNVGKIAAHTLPVVVDWLRRHQVPYDEIFIGKPWCGHDGFYVDDRAIRPSEFRQLDRAQIEALLRQEK